MQKNERKVFIKTEMMKFFIEPKKQKLFNKLKYKFIIKTFIILCLSILFFSVKKSKNQN